jgi:hypothetical protein
VAGLLAGTVSPASVSPAHFTTLAHAWVLVPPGWEAARAESFRAGLAALETSLAREQYTVLGDLFNPLQIGAIRAYTRALREGGYLHGGDVSVGLRDWMHNEPFFHFLHPHLTRILNRVVGEPVKGSYSYLAAYHAGAVLPKHTDRPQCVWNMSLALDGSPGIERDTAWPIYVEIGGQAREVRLAAGEGVVYRGTDIPHWRDALPEGHQATVCFFHFVPADFTGSLR